MKRFLSLVLALIMTASLVTISAGAEIADIDEITYKEAVEVMTAIDVIDGYPDGSFGPATNLTRGAAAKIICNLILGPTTADALRADAAPYADVPANHTFAPYIAYLAKEEIVSGYADGNFKPTNPLTGYAFMKMLLGVIGYDADIEGYTGANWSINVAKQGLALELLDGYVGTFNGTADVNRETAMLMAFNAINTQMVEYNGKSSIKVGDVEVVTVTEAKGLWYQDNNGNDHKYLVRHEYFEDLEKSNTKKADAFGRPANNWWNDKEEIGLYPKTPDLTYDAESVDMKSVYAGLGLAQDWDGSNGTVLTWKEDGMAGQNLPTAIKKKGTETVGGAGQLVEFFYDKDAKTVTGVIINNYVAEIDKVEVDTTIDETLVTVNVKGVAPGGVIEKYESDAFVEEDIVVFTVAREDATKNWEIQSMDKAEKVEGVEVSKFTTKLADKNDPTSGYTADFVGSGKVYNTAKKHGYDNSGDMTTIGNVLDLYLDEDGSVVYTVTTASAKKFAYVLAYGQDTNRYGETAEFIKILTTEGKVEELEVGKVWDAAANNGNGAFVKATPANVSALAADQINDGTNENDKIQVRSFVKYALNGDGNYSITKLNTTANDTLEVTNGVAKIADGAKNTVAYGNAKTIYLVQTGTAEAPVYTAYTGYKSVPSLKSPSNGKTGMAVWCEKNNVASIVFIGRGTTVTAGSSYVYIDGTSISGKITDANNETGYYVVPAIVDGEIKTLYVDAQLNADYMLNNIVTDEAGVVDWATTSDPNYNFEINPAEDVYTATGSVTAKLKDGVITIGGVGYAVADDADVFCVTDKKALNEADTIAAGSINGIAIGTNVSFIVENGAISVIIYTDVKTAVQ